MPPRMTKSLSVAVMFPAWCWTHSPELQFLYTSYAQDLSVRDSRRCRSLIESRWYQSRWGHKFQIVSDQNTKIRFDNNRNGYRIASSVDGLGTGEGADFIICDDPNSVRDYSDTVLDSVIHWWSNVMPTRMNDFKTGRRIIIQQRTHERDLSGYLLDSENRRDWTHLMLPMEMETRRRCVTVRLPSTGKRPWADPRTTDGELLCPDRVGPKELASLKRQLGGEYQIAGQLQQRPAPEAGGILKKSWFKIWPAAEPPKIEFSLMSIDTALTANKSSAFSAATTWGIFNDEKTGVPNVILLSMWRAKVEYPELRARLQRMAADYLDDGPIPRKVEPEKRKKPTLILIENKASGITLIQDLLRAGISAWRFDPDRYGDKIMRVRLVSHIMEAGRVWVPGQAPKFERARPWAQEFIEQAGAFPNAASRDIVDTCSQALHHLNNFGFIWHPADDRTEPTPKVDAPVAAGESAFY